MRRPTIANLSAYHRRTKGKGEHIDLEKQFLEKFEQIGEFFGSYGPKASNISTYL